MTKSLDHHWNTKSRNVDELIMNVNSLQMSFKSMNFKSLHSAFVCCPFSNTIDFYTTCIYCSVLFIKYFVTRLENWIVLSGADLGGRGAGGPGSPLTPYFEAQMFAATTTALRDLGKISLAPHLHKSWIHT